MKKNKTIAYMMAATLLVGGTFVGTKALFTDNVDNVGELTISTGDLDIEITEDTKDAKWVLSRNGEEDETGTNQNNQLFDNLKYGDVLTKQVKVRNNGTLKALVKLDENLSQKEKESLNGIEYKATLQDTNTEGIATIEPNAEKNVTFTIKVTGGGKHGDQNSLNSDTQDQTKIDLKHSYTLTATQQNNIQE